MRSSYQTSHCILALTELLRRGRAYYGYCPLVLSLLSFLIVLVTLISSDR